MEKDLARVYGSSFNQLVYRAMVIASESINSKDPEKRELARAIDAISGKMLGISLNEIEISKFNKKYVDRSGLRVLAEHLESVLVEAASVSKGIPGGHELVATENIKSGVKFLDRLASEYAKGSEARLAKAKNLRKPFQRKLKPKKRSGRK